MDFERLSWQQQALFVDQRRQCVSLAPSLARSATGEVTGDLIEEVREYIVMRNSAAPQLAACTQVIRLIRVCKQELERCPCCGKYTILY